MTPTPWQWRRLLAYSALATTLFACERAPTDGIREWKATDHDRAGNTGANMGPMGGGGGGGKKQNEAASLADLTWRNQCASCHGPVGRGDGPTGPMVGATDLTSSAFQTRVKDADIAASIRNGKGKMPKFDLPDEVVAALVLRIRMLGAGGGSAP